VADVTNYTIENNSGQNVRIDLNAVFAAIQSSNSKSTDLTSSQCVAGMPFLNTTSNILKIRNSSNGGFTEIGNIDSANLGLLPVAGGTMTGTLTTVDVAFQGDNYSVLWDKSDDALEFADNAKLVFGSSSDLTISHSGSNSVFNETGTGNLQLQLGGSTKFEVVSGGVSLTGGAASNITALSDGATITIDMATACHHSVTLGGNRTFAAPSNQVVGQSGSIFVTQDGTGSRTASFNSAFKFIGGVAPTLSTAASAIDRIDYIIKSSNVIQCAVSLDIK
jgi:hypothetical protein|tara:strand:+ start:2281 stop:3114 length:834 start_codon:yes stop_codon:yes gene_type:complete